MKIKTVLGLVLCVLLTASVSHAASSEVVFSGGTLTVGSLAWGSSPAPSDVSGGWAGADVLTSSVGWTESGTPSGTPTVTTKSWTFNNLLVPGTTFDLNMSVEELLSTVLDGDQAYTDWTVTLSLDQAGTVTSLSQSGGFDITRPTNADVVPANITVVDLGITSTGKSQTGVLSITTTAFAKAYQAAEVVDDDDNGGDDTGSTNPIPAPGAVLLSSLGAGLVGWMRRRKTL